MTAMAMMFAIPAILFTLFAQKGLIKGLTAGALKG
jgi:ABC-type glycerol-3-phosphate transport system permease component